MTELLYIVLTTMIAAVSVQGRWLSPEWVTALSTVVYTVCTVVLIFVALFQDDIRRWRNSPHLLITIKTESPWGATLLDEYPMAEGSEGYAVTYFLRLQMINRGRSDAEHVEVFANAISELDPTSRIFIPRPFEPMNLVWSYHHQIYNHLPINLPKYCDFGYVVDPKMRSFFPSRFPKGFHDSQETVFCLSTFHPSRARSYLLKPGTYLIWLTVGATNCKNVQLCVKLDLTGRWITQESHTGTQIVVPEVISVAVVHRHDLITLAQGHKIASLQKSRIDSAN